MQLRNMLQAKRLIQGNQAQAQAQAQPSPGAQGMGGGPFARMQKAMAPQQNAQALAAQNMQAANQSMLRASGAPPPAGGGGLQALMAGAQQAPQAGGLQAFMRAKAALQSGMQVPAMEGDIRAGLQRRMKAPVQGPMGDSPEQLAAMQAQAGNQAQMQQAQAQQAMQSQDPALRQAALRASRRTM